MGEAELAARWDRLAGVREPAIRAVHARVPRPEEAEDLVHEALLRLAARPGLDTGDPACLRSLVVTTACGLAIDGWRRERRRERLLDRLGAGLGAAPSAEMRVADRSEAAWLAAGLPDLGSLERAAILHAADGEPVGEIARLLGVGYKAAENALGRARRKLRLRAAAVAIALASLLRRLASHPEAPQAALLAPVLVAILLGPGAWHASGPAASAPARLAAVVAVPQQPVAGAPHATGAAAGSVRPAPAAGEATAPSGEGGGGGAGGSHPWRSPDGLPVQVAPGPESGDPLVTVGGTPVPLLDQPSSAGWAEVSRTTCATSSAACFPVAVP